MASLLTQDKEEVVIPRTAMKEEIRFHDVSVPAPPEIPPGQMRASELAGGDERQPLPSPLCLLHPLLIGRMAGRLIQPVLPSFTSNSWNTAPST